MSETAFKSALPGGPAPLPANLLPEAVAKLCAGPGPMKLLAAKGMAPLRPTDLLTAIYQLAFDADAAVREAALASVAGLPEKVSTPALAEPLPAPVLDHFARHLPVARTSAFERILYNPATDDATFARLAARLPERELEIIFQNEARLLRTPAILEALYHNPAARMSSVNRAIELCARNNVRADGIPAFDDLAKAILSDPSATEATADAAFASVLAEDDALGAEPAPTPVVDDAAPLELDLLAEPAPAAQAEAEDKSKRKSPIIDFGRLKLYEKIRLATLGNAYCRTNLMRDPNRMVALAAIRSPRITESEIVAAAGNRSVCEDVIRYIGGQRDLTKSYQVRLNLINNPKCPVAISMKFLSLLHAEDLKHLARSKNVPSALATSARRLMANRKAD